MQKDERDVLAILEFDPREETIRGYLLRRCKRLSLCEVELSLFALFNLEVNPDPIQQSSIAPPERFGATEEPAVPSFRVTNSKACLAGAARA
jgi:hypothetical protein